MTAKQFLRDGKAKGSDLKLGIAGCCLAAASASFGLTMVFRGPSSDFGKSGDFTVFAQLAGEHNRVPDASRAGFGDLDLEATASIPDRRSATAGGTTPDMTAALRAVKIASVADDRAVLVIAGRLQTVRVGDRIGDLGEVLRIVAQPQARVETTRGMIAGMADR